MTVLKDYQFELEGVVFGLGAPVHVETQGFDPGDDDIDDRQEQRPGDDSYAFGQDSLTPSAWTWEMFTATARHGSQAVTDMAALKSAWRSAGHRRLRNLIVPLRYQIAGRTRRVYGKPRRWAVALETRLEQGYSEIVADFQRADALYYEDEERVATLFSVPQGGTGFTTPIITPLTTLVPAQPLLAAVNPGGEAYAPFEVEFKGPISNPRLVSENGWEVGIRGSLGTNERITVRTYPWWYDARKADGTDVSGRISPATRLSKARLDPDGESLRLLGVDSTGLSRATVRWRPAYISI